MACIGIDFDHTLVYGATPIKGAKQAINILREAGHKVVIHSCNNPKWIEKVLRDNDIRFDHIWDDKGKPICDIYVDDKGFRFTGDWEADFPAIVAFLEGFDNRKWSMIKEGEGK